jgi:hypothetical protein
MYATVTTWRVRTTIHDDAEFDRLVHDLMAEGINVVRRAGVVDVFCVEAGSETLIAISLYETPDEAMASGPAVLKYMAEGFADRFELVSRVTGPVYEIPQFAPVDRSDAQQWRESAPAMYANVATWHLHPSIHSPEAFTAFVHQVLDESLPFLQELGLLDAMGIRIAHDTLLVVRLFHDPSAFDALYSDEAMAASQDLLAGKVELISQSTGRALDVLSALGDQA